MKGKFRRIVSFVLAVFLVIGNTFSGSSMVIYASSIPVEAAGDGDDEQPEAASTVDTPDESGTTDEPDETAPVIDIKLNGDYQSVDGTIYCAQEAPSLTVTVADNSADDANDVIDTVKYNVMSDGVEIVKETSLTLSDGSAIIDMPDDITDSVVEVSVTAEDKDGNNISADISFVIDRVKPELSTVYDNVSAVGTVSGNDSPLKCDTDIYNSQRKVTITVAEKNFSPSKLIFEVSLMDKSGENESVTKPELIWNRKENSDIYTAEYTFSEDAYYNVKISVEDLAGNPAVSDVTEAFLIDTQEPDTHKIVVSGDEYTDYAPELNFVYSNKEETEVSLEGDDENSAVIMQYYISDSTVILTEDELDGISASDWTIYTDTFTLSDEGIYTIYARFVDMAGNRIYVHSSAYVIDRTAPDLTVTVKDGNDSGVYTGNVTLNINSEDKKIYSGIKKIECDIYVADVYQETVTVYENKEDLSLYDNRVDKVDIDYELDADTYNYDNIKIVTKVTDAAENSVSAETAFSIISSMPTVEYSYSGAALTRVRAEDGYGYYPDSRILTVDITCRTSSFDEDIATAGIAVTLNGEPYDITGKISQWTTTEDDADINKAHHTAEITFDEEGYYTVSISFTDKAGNAAESVDSISDTPDMFVVDRTKPYGTITVGKLGSFSSLIDTIHFGTWTNKSTTITAKVNDAVSPVYSILYYKTSDVAAKTEQELDAVTDWSEFKPFEVTDDERYTVYLKIEDYAGNVRYICTDGIIADFSSPAFEKVEPVISINPGIADGDVYDGDVTIEVKVTDPVVNNTYSGIGSVRYEVWNGAVKTQGGQLYTYSNKQPLFSELAQTITGNIVVDAQKNNGNNIKVVVYAADNAGNDVSESVTVKIDTVKPEGSLSYGTVKWSELQSVISRDIYSSEDVKLEYAVSDALSGVKSTAYMIVRTQTDAQMTTLLTEEELEAVDGSEWVYAAEKDVLSGEIELTDDGAYVVYLKLTDMAGNVRYLSGNCIVVDKTQPKQHVIRIDGTAYEDYADGLEFVEGNFDSIGIELEGQDDVSDIVMEYYVSDSTEVLTQKELEGLSRAEWKVYTGKVAVGAEGRYTVYARFTDKAGNCAYAHSAAYIVDRTAPELAVSVKNGNALNLYSGNVTINVSAQDSGKYSGIKKIDYDIYVADELKDTVVVYENTADLSAYKNLVEKKNVDYVIDGNIYNHDNIRIVTRVTDAAGNMASAETFFDINSTLPVVDYSYSGAALKRIRTEEGYGYYPESRVLLVDITCRTTSFDGEEATKGIVVTLDGEAYDITGKISGWTTTENEAEPDKAHHTAEITLADEGYYTVSLGYTDRAGNTAVSISSSSDTPDRFVVDRSKPSGSISVENAGAFNSFIDEIHFGIWLNKAATITADVSDAVSPVYSVSYYRTADVFALTYEQLNNVEDWTEFAPFKVTSDGRYTIYLRIEDYAGNVRYINTDGIIADFTSPEFEQFEPEISIKPEFADCGVYDGDVSVDIKVADPVVNSTYSGIGSVRYEVWNGDIKTQEGEIYSFGNARPLFSELEQTVFRNIVVDAQKNNGNDIRIVVYAVDNAGNESSESVTVRIDTAEPEGNITYGANSWSTLQGKVEYGIYSDEDIMLGYDAADAVSGVKSTAYMIVRTQRDSQMTAVMTQEELAAVEESEWTYAADEDINSGELAITEDGAYIIYLRLTDEVGHVYYLSSNCIVLDKTLPDTHSIMVNGSNYSDYADRLEFIEDKFDRLSVELDGHDEVSDTAVRYYITDSTDILSEAQLDGISPENWTEYAGAFTITAEGIYTVYACYTDKSGNSVYSHSAAYIVDRTAPVLTVTVRDANDMNLYSGDVTLHIDTVDNGKYSGIRKIDYDIYVDDVLRETVTLYENKSDASVYSNLVEKMSADYVIDGEIYNHDNIHIVTRVTDTAGNTASADTYFDIDSTRPVIDYSYTGAELKRVRAEDGYGYYPELRILTVDITCRTTDFEADKATAGISVTLNGNPYDITGSISEWTTIENVDEPDKAHHIASVTLSAEGYYNVSCGYTDRAGNSATQINSTSDTPYAFVVDRSKPTGTISVGGVGTYNSLIGNLNFGIWLNSAASISANAQDGVSPIYEISYIRTPNVYAFTSSQLDAVGGWEIFRPFTVPANERYTIYLRIEDYAGNVQYISTNGIISDSVSPIVEGVEPEISLVPEFTESGIYNDDVTVNIRVSDPETNGSYSGLKRVSYEVMNMGVVTQSEVLLDYSISNPTWSELVQQINKTIKVDAKLNNSNDVRLVVYAIDNSGNDVKEELELKIDVSEPEIFVSYDNNDAVTEYADSTFFKQPRRATIEVHERNFEPSKVEVVITNTDGAIPAVSGWTVVEGTGNLDDTRNIAYIDYSSDGDYTFEIRCKDAAGNESKDAEYGSSVAPEKFTIDITEPVLSVSFDNNEGLNDIYYNASRTAVFEINEHNFDASKAVVSITASDDGRAIDVPSTGAWTDNGDIHSMSVQFTQDGSYKLHAEYVDMAGNELAQAYETEFVVDITAPVVEITGVENMSANNGDVMPVVTLSDTNISYDDIRLTLVGANRGEVELDGKYTDIHNGRVFTFNNFADEKEIDDIYTLTASVVDRAGNETVSEIMFSVNRFGSTYTFSDSTRALLGKFIRDEEDIVITEINPNELTEFELTLFKNNETIVLERDKDYSVNMDGTDGSWYSYTYTIFKENFADDGVYRISVYSKDMARNTSENSLEDKGAEISFGIDKTLPNIIITGVESDRTYAQETKEVIITASDNLKLSELVVMLNGAEYKRWSTQEIDDMVAANEDFVISVDESNKAQQLIVTAYDAAGNEASQTIDNFYVTTNAWIRFYNNKIAFFGSIAAGVALLGGGGGYLGFFLRRKKLAGANKKQA